MSLTPPVLLMVLGFPLLVMAGMLMMGGIEKRLIGSRSLLSLVAEEAATTVGAAAAGGPEKAAGSGLPPRPALTGPFRTDDVPTAPLRFSLPTVISDGGSRAPRSAPAPSMAVAMASSATVPAAYTLPLGHPQPASAAPPPPLAG
ncbi:hypothetical protein [Frankia sp. QA3]|uniref:hypothetical protein n=1 Tax=Frankia sp. QA3 TaxID=710111 RepID=UPI000269C529|nr:hypothetical protein [Frankia sp. QA3]EIV95026.1 hypothetical protein FraQA3DRAFT_4826 [Frankia sp. QA3]